MERPRPSLRKHFQAFQCALVHSNGIRVDLFTEEQHGDDLYYTTVYKDGPLNPPVRCWYRYSWTADMDVNGFKVRARFPFEGIAKGPFGPNWKKRIKQKDWNWKTPYCIDFPYTLPDFIPKIIEKADEGKDNYKCRGSASTTSLQGSTLDVALQKMAEDLDFAGTNYVVYGETHVRLLLECTIKTGKAYLVVPAEDLTKALVEYLVSRSWKQVTNQTELGQAGARVVLKHGNDLTLPSQRSSKGLSLSSSQP